MASVNLPSGVSDSGSGVVAGRVSVLALRQSWPHPSCISVRCQGEELGNQAGKWPRPVQTGALLWEAEEGLRDGSLAP